ncbi:NnrU family protein [bacterium]|nr:NnrU family protein [bacterium]
MASLGLAGAVFVGIHLFIAGTRLRDRIVAAIGEQAYLGLFSLLSIASLGWLILAYRAAPRVLLWHAPAPLRVAAIALMTAAVALVVIGLTTPSPTATGGAGALDRADAARGILRVTRHPFLCGVALWAALHLLVNGDSASLVLFGALLTLASIGPPSIDAKRQRAFGGRWRRFAEQTSVLPFAAIAAGRNTLRVDEIGAWRAAAAIAAYAALLLFHGRLFGAPAW